MLRWTAEWRLPLAAFHRSEPAARLAIASMLVFLLSPLATAQLEVLSQGDLGEQWRLAQISSLKEQLASQSDQGALQEELTEQLTWLSAWRSNSLTAQPFRPSIESTERMSEPTIDPEGVAMALRARLLGENASPTVEDTEELKRMLKEHPLDIGMRQLHLHWLDQLHYRKEYCDQIAAAAAGLIVLLDQERPQTKELEHARAFCLYRRARALAYRELPDVVSLRPIEDPQALDTALWDTYNQLKELVQGGEPAFVLLDIRMLRRDKWYGRALGLLEEYGNQIDRKWYLKKRRDLLRELGWAVPSEEAAAIYAKEFPEAVAEEQKEG